MRSDMAKVIVERPRLGPRIKHPKGECRNINRIPIDEQPRREKIRRKWIKNYSGKELNEHLNPLYRWLKSKVGQPWDKVYSEICENISINSAVQSHVRDHIDHMVEKNVIIIDGKPTHSNYERLPLSSYGWRDTFYVHPVTKLLCVADKFEYDKYDNDPLKQKNKTIQYHRINGIWYELTLNKQPKPKVYRSDYRSVMFYDIAYKINTSMWRLDDLYGDGMRPIKKRQLNGKEIALLNL